MGAEDEVVSIRKKLEKYQERGEIQLGAQKPRAGPAQGQEPLTVVLGYVSFKLILGSRIRIRLAFYVER